MIAKFFTWLLMPVLVQWELLREEQQKEDALWLWMQGKIKEEVALQVKEKLAQREVDEILKKARDVMAAHDAAMATSSQLAASSFAAVHQTFRPDPCDPSALHAGGMGSCEETKH